MPEGHESQTSYAERRKHPRHIADTPVTVRVLVEEETFSPFVFEGLCENASRSGALVTVSDMTPDVYRKLIRRPRYVRIICQKAGHEQTLTLFGKLIWYDFRDDQETTICKLAMAFEPMQDELAEAFERYLGSLPRTQE
jgi:ribosomal protein L36